MLLIGLAYLYLDINTKKERVVYMFRQTNQTDRLTDGQTEKMTDIQTY